MGPVLPLPGKYIPLRCEGAVSMRDGWSLIVKSPRSALLFFTVWAAARLTGILSRNIMLMADVVNTWDVLDDSKKIRGFLIFTSPDKRERSYVVVHTETDSLFAKVGKDVSYETIVECLAERLEAQGFRAYLPLACRTDGTVTINIYPFLRPAHYKKMRFSPTQAKQFSKALNEDVLVTYETLKTVLACTPKHPLAVNLFCETKIHILCDRLAEVPVAMGRCHGDLMSPNMYCSKDGMLPIFILDWESYESKAPLVLDLVGGQDWAAVLQQANKTIESSNPQASEALIFMLIAGARGFRPALDWLEQNLNFLND